ncbi:MAG: superoxide dismutase, Ni [Phycisphaerales bacterium]|nr:superoxide dismutase, Ni [Phycisphaerales bacterium]
MSVKSPVMMAVLFGVTALFCSLLATSADAGSKGLSGTVPYAPATPVSSTALHCEIPCGIYDDSMMIKKMLLAGETISKASAQITLLSGKVDATSLNTISRWVLIKEEHSRELQHDNSWYFMTQRVKFVPAGEAGHDAYLERLSAHHRISVAAMKAAQSLDPAVQKALSDAIKAVAPWYPPAVGADAGEGEGDWMRIADRAGS